MKRTLLATAVGLAFIGASAQLALAQPFPAQGAGGNSIQYGQPQESPGDSVGGWQHWRRAHRWRYSQNEPNQAAGPGAGPGAPPPPLPVPHHPPPPKPANAAHFVFQRGRARIDITCPQAFALNDCIQAAAELLDKIHSLRAGEQHRGAAVSPGGAPVPGSNSAGGQNGQTGPSGGGGPPMPNSTGNNQM
ncbi:MAG: hypothetical protein ACRECV_08525 [Xanthobacteraceae bacterium]